MGEISQQQVLDLLYEVADDVAELNVMMHETVVLMRTINYEMELGLQQIAEARSQYCEKVSAP